MKLKFLAVFTSFALLLTGSFAMAEEKKGNPKTDLEKLLTEVKGELAAGKTTEAALAEDIKKFDTLLEKYKGDKENDDVAQILVMKAMLYLQVFQNTPEAIKLIKQLGAEYPNTTQGSGSGQLLEQLEKQMAAEKVKAKLKVGNKFPEFEAKDLDGKPLSISRFKGKVLLVDFWATWCGPCIAELPHVQDTYKAHHKDGFEVLGISLDSDETKLNNFLKKEKMTWPQYYDGKGWSNELAQKYGVNSIPATYLLDGEGKIIGSNLRGNALKEAVAAALKK